MTTPTLDYSRDANFSSMAITTLKDRYLLANEKSPQDAFMRVAKAFADDDEHAQRLYDYASNKWMMFATPVLVNGGNKRGLPISCYLGYVPDSTEGILSSYTEACQLTRNGGGIGYHLGDLRSDNEATSIGTKSTGVIGFIKPFETLMLAFAQGQNRRGAVATYMDISHPEIEEFVTIRKPGGDQNRKCWEHKVFHHAVNIPDAFMEAVKEDGNWSLIDPNSKTVKKTIKARDLWIKLLETRMETGEPYFMFIDEANRKLPQPLKDKGLKIRQSNLCVAPETKVLTDFGYQTIAHLEGRDINVWNGQEWSSVVVHKTSEKAKLLKVTFSDGSVLECTPEHKFYVLKTNRSASDPVVVRAKDLVTGMLLEKFDLPQTAEGCDWEMNGHDPYSQGFYSGDGNNDLEHSWLYAPKYMCQDRLTGTFSEEHDSAARKTWKHGPMYDKAFVPLGLYSLDTKLNWLAGLLDADGCVLTSSSNGKTIQLSSINKDFLVRTKWLLQELGVYASTTFRREEGEYYLPKNDGTGEAGLFNCQEVWLLTISTKGVERLVELGIRFSRLNVETNNTANRVASRFISVVSVEDNGREDATYCFTEPLRHRGVFNGILTGNCNEIFLPTNEERTAVCCLSSVNLEKYDEWKDDPLFIEDMIRMLDNVLSDFISKAQKKVGFQRAVASALAERSIGLGAMGFHYYLQSKGVPFESAMARGINKSIFKGIKEKAVAASQKLAKERGEAPDMVGTGMRNAHLLAIAPNASIGDIVSTSPSIEPLSTNYFVKKTDNGSFIIKNKHLQDLLGELHKDTEEVWKDIRDHDGSVQHLDFLTQDQKDTFKTAFELDQRWVVQHAADRQEFICQGQSVNLFFPNDTSKKELHEVHLQAYEQKLKGLYYCRSTAQGRVSSVGKSIERQEIKLDDNDPACLGCEG